MRNARVGKIILDSDCTNVEVGHALTSSKHSNSRSSSLFYCAIVVVLMPSQYYPLSKGFLIIYIRIFV
jgi:hypothetical protein